ncbi:MAG: MaoC family dehydratase [Alphaproteobacteria bacterium]|nr:MaoC family dehydratase [Alphaproteobacteria bacterium]
MNSFYSHVKIAENVYRERNGVDFEDLEPGMIFQHRPGRTVYQSENALHSLSTLNQAAIHIDAEYAARTEFKKPLIVTTLSLGIIMAMTTKTFGKVCANLGMTDVNMLAPVFDGDTLYSESEVLSKRLSKSRPDNGVLSIKTVGRNQNGIAVCEYKRTLLLYLRGHGPYEAANY